MGRCSVSLLVISLILLSLVLGFPGEVKQLGQEPMIRVYLSKNPKGFALGATGAFSVNEYASGKTLYSGKGELQCSFSNSESMSFSIFVDTFYSRDDATMFGEAMQSRFPVKVPVNIRADGKLFRLEMGKYKSEEEAQKALDEYFSDIPSAVLIGSIGLAIRLGDKLVFRPPTNRELLNLVSIVSTDGGLVKFKGKRYRGTITLCMGGEDFYVVNKLLMEDYVKGVTPAEMPATWPLEAVKAQAICARTYALRYDSSNPAYDICKTQACQVYIGYEHEHKNSNRAVDETRGEVATYGGKMIGTYFHSTSGGMTENSENVWVATLPYLKGVDSTGEEISSKHTWMHPYSNDDFSKRIKKAGKKDIGKVYAWRPIKRGVSPRIMKAEFSGTKGKVELSGSKIQYYLDLEDRWIDVMFIPSKVVVVGHGYGHGIGMSQYGARARALEGKNYRQILKHYYTGIEITKWY
jgi:stage II sporulation protein D (peptidoglycan lytic transglycosylase)